MSEYGAEIPLATYGIMMKLGHIVTSLSTGMGQGAQPVIGYCYGSASYERVKKTIRFAIIQGLTIGVCVWAVCMIFAKNILLLFGSGSALYVRFDFMPANRGERRYAGRSDCGWREGAPCTRMVLHEYRSKKVGF